MPHPEISGLHQKAVLWPATGKYDDYGQPKIGTAEEIKVRWLKRNTEVLDRDGNMINVDATAVVDKEVAIGSQMWLGALADWLATGSGSTTNQVMQVKSYRETPDIGKKAYMRRVGLLRIKEET